MTAKRVSQKVPDKVFNNRSGVIFNGMRARAIKAGIKAFPFSLGDFRLWLLERFNGKPDGITRCEYSGDMLVVEDFSVDHRFPVSRGGYFGLQNLAICSKKENLRKGNMTEVEYQQFKQHVSRYVPEVQAAIWRKLEVGDVQRFSYFKRKRAAQ
jgi:hypothetical protein